MAQVARLATSAHFHFLSIIIPIKVIHLIFKSVKRGTCLKIRSIQIFLLVVVVINTQFKIQYIPKITTRTLINKPTKTMCTLTRKPNQSLRSDCSLKSAKLTSKLATRVSQSPLQLMLWLQPLPDVPLTSNTQRLFRIWILKIEFRGY